MGMESREQKEQERQHLVPASPSWGKPHLELSAGVPWECQQQITARNISFLLYSLMALR